MTKFNTSHIKSLSEYTALLEKRITDKYRITLFRGQNTDRSLIPSIARHYFKKSRELDEKRMLEEFNLQSVQYLKYHPNTDLERLTIAQHHGVPTRLLDWTENALAALYFAVSKAPEKNDSAVVWILSVDRDSTMLLDRTDFDVFSNTEVKLFKPSSIIPRVTSQFGWFSCHPYRGQGFYERIDKEYSDSTRLNKIVIDNGCTGEILSALESCGVNRHSIFRDLDSLGQYIFEKYRKSRS